MDVDVLLRVVCKVRLKVVFSNLFFGYGRQQGYRKKSITQTPSATQLYLRGPNEHVNIQHFICIETLTGLSEK